MLLGLFPGSPRRTKVRGPRRVQACPPKGPECSIRPKARLDRSNICFKHVFEMSQPTAEVTHETRERILDAAEFLFGERGFESVSLRDITGRAGANVAAVNYHFGSKEKLVDAVVVRHAVPINDGRMRLLLEAEDR